MSWQTPENLSADGIRATVTGTAGAGKVISDDGASGLVWAAPGGNPAIADITDWPSGLTATEIGYVNGVTSAIQTQLDAKQATLSSGNKLGLAAGGSNADLSATGGATHFLRQASAGAAVTVAAIGASDLPTGIDAAKLHDGSIGNTDLVCIKDLATTGGAGHFLKQNSVGGAITSEVPTASVTAVCCQVTKTTETITANTWTDIAFNSEEIDTDTMHDNTTNNNRIVVPSTGKYLIIAHIVCNPGGAHQGRAAINLNGTRSYPQFFYPTTNAVFNGHSVSWLVSLTASQYVGLQLHIANNTYVHGTDNGTDSAASTRLTVIKIGG